MTPVEVGPMPLAYRSISPRFRPSPPPVFPEGEPTQSDRELALALLLELDAESRAWYLNGRTIFVGLAVPTEFL